MSVKLGFNVCRGGIFREIFSLILWIFQSSANTFKFSYSFWKNIQQSKLWFAFFIKNRLLSLLIIQLFPLLKYLQICSIQMASTNKLKHLVPSQIANFYLDSYLDSFYSRFLSRFPKILCRFLQNYSFVNFTYTLFFL